MVFVYTQLNVLKKILFQTVQFSISTLFSSIGQIELNIDRILSRARVDLGAMSIKEYSAFLKAPALLDLHHQFRVISKTLVGGVLPFGRNAVGVFYSLSLLG